MSVRLETTHGPLLIKLYWKETPRTCRNFVELAKSGYYDGVYFHRIVPDFVAQTGDPYGDGRGGESIYGPFFDDEIVGKLSHDRRGCVSMANSGRNTNNSQFFIIFKPSSHLDGKHTLFGQVTADTLKVLDDFQLIKINEKTKRPIGEVKIFTAVVEENPWEGQPLPEDCRIPDKPLINEKQKCVIQ